MPLYTLKRLSTGEEWDINVPYSELKDHLNEDVVKVLSTPGFAGNTTSNLRRAGSGWSDLLGQIKKGSGRGNTVKT